MEGHSPNCLWEKVLHLLSWTEFFSRVSRWIHWDAISVYKYIECVISTGKVGKSSLARTMNFLRLVHTNLNNEYFQINSLPHWRLLFNYSLYLYWSQAIHLIDQIILSLKTVFPITKLLWGAATLSQVRVGLSLYWIQPPSLLLLFNKRHTRDLLV